MCGATPNPSKVSKIRCLIYQRLIFPVRLFRFSSSRRACWALCSFLTFPYFFFRLAYLLLEAIAECLLFPPATDIYSCSFVYFAIFPPPFLSVCLGLWFVS